MEVDSLRVGLAFSAGVATFFAPCAFPLLPGYVAFYLGRGDGGTDATSTARGVRRAAAVGLLASLGFFLVYGVLAAIVASLGASALADIALLEVVVGGLLVVLGVAMASGRVDTSAFHLPLPERRRSATGYLLFGVVYGVAAAGCTAPVFVGLALFALGNGPVGAAVTLGAYALGMSVLMVAVTLLSALGREGSLHVLQRNTGGVSRLAGALLALAGVTQLYLFVFDFDYLGILRLL
jgi:cytochrome c-type biogenesis protein